MDMQIERQLAPPEREFARHVALVTGAAGGIGSATCRRLAQDGAHIVATDIDLAGAEQLAAYLNQHYGARRAVAVKMDVTKEESVGAAFTQAASACSMREPRRSSSSACATSRGRRAANWIHVEILA